MTKKQPKQKLDPFWEKRPEWLEKVDKVMKLTQKGFNQDQIIAITDIPQIEVRRIQEDENYIRDLVDRNNKEAVPLMERIRALGLEVLGEFMKELVQPEVRSRLVKSVKDAIAVKVLVNDMTLLIRLEKDKSTQNIAVNSNVTKQTIEYAAKVDPVFSYPILKDETKDVANTNGTS